MPSDKKFTLRMDSNLFNEIAEIAENNRRSVAKEIEQAIASSIYEYRKAELIKRFKTFGDPPPEGTSDRLFQEILALDKKYKV